MKAGSVIIFIVILIIFIFWVGTLWEAPVSPLFPSSQKLNSTEIREIDGRQLNSIIDFRENSIKGPQVINPESYRLVIDGLVQTPLNFSYENVLRTFPSYTKIITLHCVEGWDVTLLWEGILVSDLLIQAGPNPEADTIIFHAYDGYTTSLPVETVIDRQILLAYAINNVTLPAERGFPFQLAAEDKWGYKWIKWVTRIELSDDENYEGYWESRGYSDDAEYGRSFF